MRCIKNIRNVAATVLLSSLSSLPAWAGEHGGGGKGGLPQFDPVWFPEQIFWLVVTFAMLYILMTYVALPMVARTQTNRKKVITTEIETAKAANEKAKASVLMTDKALNDARCSAEVSVSEMMSRVTQEGNERRATSERELLRKLRSAEERVATARASALEHVQAASDDLAKEIVKKILEVKERVNA